jgi:prepilin-type processing-associated H-X9-DG protein
MHPGGANFLFADDGVRFIKELIGFTILQSLATKAGCAVISADQFRAGDKPNHYSLTR